MIEQPTQRRFTADLSDLGRFFRIIKPKGYAIADALMRPFLVMMLFDGLEHPWERGTPLTY
jgi:hypothetical protein